MFQSIGFAVDELHEASRFLASSDPPRFRADHLKVIIDRVRRRRGDLARSMDERGDPDGWVPCHWCQDAGWSRVPNLCDVRQGEFVDPFRTYVVTCKCNRGVRIQASCSERKKQPMRLVDYEAKNELWVQQMVRQESMESIRSAANEASHSADGRTMDHWKLYPAVVSLMKKFNIREPGCEG